VNVVELYQQGGLGLKRLAKLSGLSPSGVRKKLRAAGVYQGLAKETRKNLFPAARTVNRWKTTGNATVKREYNGLRLYLPDALSIVSYPLSTRKQTETCVHIRLAPVAALFGALRFGLRDGNQESVVTAIVQGNLLPAQEWVAALSVNGKGELFFQGGASPSVLEFYLSEAWLTFD